MDAAPPRGDAGARRGAANARGPRLRALAIGLLVLAAPVRAGAAQDRGARLDVTLPARAVAGEGPQVATMRVLADADVRELLRSGFPARLSFRCELWRDATFNNVREAALEWDVIVRWDPLDRKYDTYRVANGRATRTGRFDTPAEMEAFVDRPYRIAAPPLRRGQRYYYEARVDIEVLSVRELDEVERWLRGVPGERDRTAGTAAGEALRGLVARLLGGERRQFEARSATFRAE
ncbi:MAG: hypothetical protein MUF21_10630 [Gemmatimonadaceae bacterium]|nr:hypothetical protein [Gemmatimonadaceae bacterium]